MIKMFQIVCAHNSGITIVTEKVFTAGCTLEDEYKYIRCSRCGKILIDSDLLEELTGVQESGK